ncbi:MAG: hypothetical protein JW774_00745, partial [Candidatus Aureabacteria bacterium]|nr:hypothetical protein [Candidatus Auribacterota bacterium]
MNPTKLTKEKGIALILVLGVIFVLGVIVGSFAFFSSNANKTTKQYANYLSAQNYADAGYQYMTGAIQDYFNIIIPMITADRFENNAGSIEFPITVNGQEVDSIATLLSIYPNKTLEEIMKDLNIEIPNETKITSNDFNNIQAAL